MSASGRVRPIALHNLNVSFLRNGNHFPDSGRHRAALHEAGGDPRRHTEAWITLASASHGQRAQDYSAMINLTKTDKLGVDADLASRMGTSVI